MRSQDIKGKYYGAHQRRCRFNNGNPNSRPIQAKSAPFQIEGEIVWGATAMMLNEFRMILREII